ncbi:MAG: hypothetical protein AAF738_10750, partial [Bacteroidota bacterium]
MKDKRLDKTIKEKLERLEVPYQADTWDALAERLDQEAEQTHAFDEAIRQKIEGLPTNLQPRYWNDLLHILDAKAVRWQLYRYKITEVVLLSLLLFTIGQFTDFDTSNRALKTESFCLENCQENSTAFEEMECQSDANGNTAFLDNTNVSIATAKIETPQATRTIEVQKSRANDYPILILPPTPVLFIPKPVPISIVQDRTEDLTSATVPTSIIADNVDEKVVRLRTPYNSPALSETPLPFLDVQSRSMEQSMLLAGNTPSPARRGMYLSLQAMLTVDHFKSTSNDNLFLAQQTPRAIVAGYGAGVRLGFLRGKWLLETGILYGSKSYRPFSNLIVYGNFDEGYSMESIDRTDFEIFEMPVRASYGLIKKGKWNTYSIAGGALHIVNDYTTTIKHIDLEDSSFTSFNIIDNIEEIRKIQVANTFANDASKMIDFAANILFEVRFDPILARYVFG